MSRASFKPLVLLVACAAPATSWSERIEPDARFRDASHRAVVLVGRWCSGTHIGGGRVLTAAHCLVPRSSRPRPDQSYGPRLPRVWIGEDSYEAQRCSLHPGAYGVQRCVDRPDTEVEASHDLAVLEYGSLPTRAMQIRLAGTLPSEAWSIGWHRRPPSHGTLHRYAGQVGLRGLRGGTLVTESNGPDEGAAFASRRGNSGGPLLIDGRVAGVLSQIGHTLPRRAYYAPTFTEGNQRWLQRVLGSSGR